MNTNNAKEFLPLVQALAEGKEIEFFDFNEKWTVIHEVNFSFSPERYRVKPPLVEVWANVYNDCVCCHFTKKSAEENALKSVIKTVRLVEAKD